MDLLTHLLAALAVLGGSILFVTLPWAIAIAITMAQEWFDRHILHKEPEEDYGW